MGKALSKPPGGGPAAGSSATAAGSATATEGDYYLLIHATTSSSACLSILLICFCAELIIADDYTGEEIVLAQEFTHANNKALCIDDFQLLKVNSIFRLHIPLFTNMLTHSLLPF
jgi:hypothetical protein